MKKILIIGSSLGCLLSADVFAGHGGDAAVGGLICVFGVSLLG